MRRSEHDGIGLEDVDTLQLELEALLSATVVRKFTLKEETKVLSNIEKYKSGGKLHKKVITFSKLCLFGLSGIRIYKYNSYQSICIRIALTAAEGRDGPSRTSGIHFSIAYDVDLISTLLYATIRKQKAPSYMLPLFRDHHHQVNEESRQKTFDLSKS